MFWLQSINDHIILIISKTKRSKKMTSKILKRNKQFLLFLFIALSSAVLLNSCYPGEELTPEVTDIIATFFDKNADFSTKMTYAMPDSVFELADSSLTPVDLDNLYDDQILDRIEQNLQQMGFTEESDPADADVHVLALVTTTTWVSGGCYYDYWSYWYPYYGWCYPVVYTYQTGTIVILMTDPDKNDDNKTIWIAGINGILEDTSTGIAVRINTNIDQAFDQSPYLGEGK